MTCGYCNESEFLFSFVLYTHILYLRLRVIDEIAEFKSFLQCLARIVGMDMDFDYLLIIHHNNAVADSFEICTERGNIGTALIFFKHELCAVRECYIIVILAYSGAERVGSDLRHSFKNYNKSHSACVYNACFFKLWEHFRSP